MCIVSKCFENMKTDMYLQHKMKEEVNWDRCAASCTGGYYIPLRQCVYSDVGAKLLMEVINDITGNMS